MAQPARIRIDLNSGIPAVRQIADNLRVLLVDGTLPAGAVLPSVRRLAIEAGVHFNTVSEAYRQLASEGWLDLQHGRGATVLARSKPAPATRELLDTFRDRLNALIAQMRSEGLKPARIAVELRRAAEGLNR